MSDENKKCTVCGQKLDEGFLLDFGYGNQYPTRWIKGPPEKTYLGMVAWSDRENVGVRAFKCVICGHIELYGDAEPWRTKKI